MDDARYPNEVNVPDGHQKVILKLQEHEFVRWDDENDFYVRYLKDIGEVVGKFPAKGGGWICIVKPLNFIEDLNRVEVSRPIGMKWVNPEERLPVPGVFVLVKGENNELQRARWSPKDGWRSPFSSPIQLHNHLYVDEWLEGLDPALITFEGE